MVAVNVSARQIEASGFPDDMAAALGRNGVSANCLEVEITERVLLQEATLTLAVLDRLKEIGVTLAIDDFGTGYSALAYLKRFPFDVLKVDRTFVNDVTLDAEDASLTSAMIAMAHALGLKVVGEGVETTEQKNFLVSQNCDVMQGYLFSRPLPADDFLAFAARYEPDSYAPVRAQGQRRPSDRSPDDRPSDQPKIIRFPSGHADDA